MNALLRWWFAAAALAATGTALARSFCEQTSPARADAAQASTYTADGSTNGQNGSFGGQFFRIDGTPPRQLNPSAQRRAVRASLQQRDPDLAEAVGISASTAEKLLDVLTEHQLADQLGAPNASSDWLLKEAHAATKRLEALRAVLGEEALEHYVDYSTTLRERTQVSAFNACLPSEFKLRAAQTEQMLALYQEDNARQLATTAAYEEHLRAMSQSHGWFSQRAAEFLTMPQLAVLSQIHAEREQSLRQWIEKARLKVGLDPVIPVAFPVKLAIKLTVNRNEPIAVSHVVTNGAPVTFEAGDGLLVEVTSTLYDDDSLSVRWAYYEQRTLRKRRLTDTTSVSTLPPDGAPREIENFTVTTGSKVYAITANVSVATL